MNLDDVIPLIYDYKGHINYELNRRIPQVDCEIIEVNKEKDRESISVIKQQYIPVILPKRLTILNDNSQTSKFPILIPGKVKMPVFISFDLTTENEKG